MQFKMALALTFTLILSATSALAAVTDSSQALLQPQATTSQKQAIITPVMTIEQMNAALKGKTPPIPVHVGFEFLYKQGHIPGSIFGGEGRSPEARAKIMGKLKALPNDRTIVLYCGCCPWEDCPNVQPIYEETKALKGKTIKLLEIPNNFEADWIKKGYPTTSK